MALQITSATFNGAQPLDGDYPYVDVSGLSYSGASAYGIRLSVTMTDVSSGLVTVVVKSSSKSGSGFRILASDQFSGTVEVETWDK